VSTLLIDKYSLDECIRHSEWENLDFITSGPLPPNPAELIGSQKTDALINDLKQRYDVLVIDTPPVGMVTDALHIIKKSDIPIYVLRADYSSRNFLNNVNHLMNDHNISELSVVLNDMGEGASIYHYNYGYGYGYGTSAYGYDYYSDEVPQKRGFLPRMVAFVKSMF
jgi:capsular exopolysaccharide synthesis family protein